MVLLSLYTSGRSNDHFSEPLTVNPKRWFPNDNNDVMSGVHKSHASLPFAIGSRSCIGRKVALAQMHCLIRKVSF